MTYTTLWTFLLAQSKRCDDAFVAEAARARDCMSVSDIGWQNEISIASKACRTDADTP